MAKPANSQAFYPKAGPTSQVGLSAHANKSGFDLEHSKNQMNQKKTVRKYLADNGAMSPTGRFGHGKVHHQRKGYSKGAIKVARAY